MKSNIKTIFVLAIVASLFLFFFAKNREGEEKDKNLSSSLEETDMVLHDANPETQKHSAQPPVRRTDSATSDSSIKNNVPLRGISTAEESEDLFPYFTKTLSTSSELASLYKKSEKIFSQKKLSHQLINTYIASGLILSSAEEFATFMNSLNMNIAQNSENIFDDLKQNMSALKEEPFLFQMALNLAFHLNIEERRKAEILGQGLTQAFKNDKSGQVTIDLMATNISNALILMINSGIELNEAAPYIARGEELNARDEVSHREFLSRVWSYYPDYQQRL